MPKPSLAKRIATDPVYDAVIRLVGYMGIAYPIGEGEASQLDQKFGKEKVMAAAEQLLDFDHDAKIARLKPGVRRLSTAIIGPAPEDWDRFYEGIENPPPNPYTKAPEPKPKRKRHRRLTVEQETNLVAEAVADSITQETGHNCEVKAPADKPDSRVITVGPLPPDLPAGSLRWTDPRRYFSGKNDKQLAELLETNHHELTQCKPGSESFQHILHENGLIAAEQRRRAIGETGRRRAARQR